MTKDKKNKFTAFSIWLSVTVFYCYQYILRIMPNIIMPDLIDNFGINAVDFGSFAGIYYIGYIGIHIPIGILLSKFGARRVLSICILFTALGMSPVIYSNSWIMVIFGRFMTGVGSSAAIVGALQIFRIIYPDSFTKMLGISVSLGVITVVFIGSPLSKFIINFGIENAINTIIICGVLLAIINYTLMPKSIDAEDGQDLWMSIKSVLANYKLISASILAGLMVGPLEGFADAWGSAFLIQVHGLGKVIADDTVVIIFLGMAVGSLILPNIAERTGCFYLATIISGLVMIACFGYILTQIPIEAYVLKTICFIIGFFCSYQIAIISKISTYVRESLSGLAASVVNMIIMAFGWVFHNSIGSILEYNWDGLQEETGRHIYSTEAFVYGLSIIPIAMMVAISGMALIAQIKDRNNQ